MKQEIITMPFSRETCDPDVVDPDAVRRVSP